MTTLTHFSHASKASDMQDHRVMNTLHATPHHATFHPHFNEYMITGYIIVLSACTLMIAAANVPGSTMDSQFAILTLAGAMMASATAFLVNTAKEPVRIVFGRAFFSAACGVVGTRVLHYKIEWVKSMITSDQILTFGFGFALGFAGFLLALPFIRTSASRADSVAKKLVDTLENRYAPKSDGIDSAHHNKHDS